MLVHRRLAVRRLRVFRLLVKIVSIKCPNEIIVIPVAGLECPGSLLIIWVRIVIVRTRALRTVIVIIIVNGVRGSVIRKIIAGSVKSVIVIRSSIIIVKLGSPVGLFSGY